MTREREPRSPRGLRNPHEATRDYTQRFDIEETELNNLSTPLIEYVEGECPFPFEEFDTLKEDNDYIEKIINAGDRYESAHEKHISIIKNHIKERFNLDESRSEVILSGNGSAGIIEKSLDLLPSPPLKSQIFVIGPSFPFIISSALSRRDQNKGMDLNGAYEQDTDTGVINIDMKGEGIGSIFMPLGAKTEDTLSRAMQRREQLNLKRPILYYVCNPNTPQGDVVPFDKIREFAEFGAERGDAIFIDEAYGDWIEDSESAMPLTNELPNLIVSRTLSKPFRLAGWRIGYASMSKGIGERYNKAQEHNPFSLGGPQQKVAEFALRPENVQLHLEGKDTSGNIVKEGIRDKTQRIKKIFIDQLDERDVFVLPTDLRTPIFTIVGLNNNFYENLIKEGIAYAPGSGFSLTHDEMDNSLVRAIIPPHEDLIPGIVDKIHRANEAE